MSHQLLNHEALNEGNVVSIIGRFGVPTSSTTTKLIAQQLVGHEHVRAARSKSQRGIAAVR